MSSLLCFVSEETIDRSFWATISPYHASLPAWQRAALESSRQALLPRRQALSPEMCVQLLNLLWDHHGTLLERSYHVKETLKQLLATDDADERLALANLLQSQATMIEGTPLSHVLSEVRVVVA